MAELHTSYNNKQVSISGTENDKKVAEYINKYGDIVFDNKIMLETNWQIFYQLSELRTGILSWYDFGNEAEVLEIGAGFGALTGMLCRKCKHVTATERSLFRAKSMYNRYEDVQNLDIYAGSIEEIKLNKKFDYILLIGLFERIGEGSQLPDKYVDYLNDLKPLLKTTGKILMAVENRLGLKYFCGAVEPHTNRAFDGLNKYPKGTKGRSFSKKELIDIISKAGFSDYKFYYPLPDYKFTQLVYTDDYLPEKNLKERLIPYYLRNDTLIANELDLYDDIIENEMFSSMSNAYLIEMGHDALFSNVHYAAVSTDRGTHRSYATTINSNQLVIKKPLYPSGEKSAEALYNHIIDLENHDIPVVKHNWVDGHIEMPYINQQTLSNYIKEIIQSNEVELFRILDRLYDYILQSSIIIDDHENKLLTTVSSLDWGPILQKAYIELIPLNCFYEDGNFLFFDQEFVRESYPAKYILFRAIHYIYCFTPHIEEKIPLKRVMEKYALTKLWEVFLEEENRFLAEVRNHHKYKQFYKWSKIDKKRIYENPTRLESEEEVIANYKISDKMKKIWKVELDILDKVDEICKKHELSYFIVHGTLLGAVRHKGFIPWDDDLDIGMLRKDYDRFLSIAQEELKEPLFLQSPGRQDCFYGGFTRIRNSQTTAIEPYEFGSTSNQGIWIDILPLDYGVQDEEKFQKKQEKIRRCHRLLYAKIYGRDYKKFMDMNVWQWNIYKLGAFFYSRRALANKLDRTMRLYTDDQSETVAFYSGYFKHRLLNKKDFSETVLLEFEGRKIPAPIGYKNYLFMSMGKNYMKYPSESERKPKHIGIFDPERPYQFYQDKFLNSFKDIKGKKVIVFGAGMMFEDYMKKLGNKYKPFFLVDNDKFKWGRKKMGIEIKAPDSILEIPENKRRIIICSYYYKEIEAQLKKMGINDYQVYVQEINWILESEEK